MKQNYQPHPLLTSVAILASLASSVAFAQQRPAAQSAEATLAERNLMRVARELQKAVVTLPNYGLFDDIRFALKDGGSEVILRGFASRPTLKSSVENVAKKIEGVRKVTNEIEVLPLSRLDDDIRIRTYIAIYGYPTLSRYNPNRGTPLFMSRASAMAGITTDPPPGYHPVHIIVKNGNVTLEGVLDSVGDKSIAEIQANSVPGVFKVTNNIQVGHDEIKSQMGKSGKK